MTVLFISSLLLLPFIVVTKNITLTCDDVLQYPDDIVSYSSEELNSMSGEDIDKCLNQLGRVRLPMEQAKIIWNSLIYFYGDISSIPEEKLITLHWITIAIEPYEYQNLTMASIDIVENFGLFYDLSEEQLEAIADRVREDWGDKFPEDYTSYDLMALKQILCAFNSSEITRIHSSAYKDAAATLGTLQKCPREVLEALAQLAIDEQAFGPADKWDKNLIKTIGVVYNGLPSESKMPKDKSGSLESVTNTTFH